MDDKKCVEGEEKPSKEDSELKDSDAQKVVGGAFPSPVNGQITDS